MMTMIDDYYHDYDDDDEFTINLITFIFEFKVFSPNSKNCISPNSKAP